MVTENNPIEKDCEKKVVEEVTIVGKKEDILLNIAPNEKVDDNDGKNENCVLVCKSHVNLHSRDRINFFPHVPYIHSS